MQVICFRHEFIPIHKLRPPGLSAAANDGRGLDELPPPVQRPLLRPTNFTAAALRCEAQTAVCRAAQTLKEWSTLRGEEQNSFNLDRAQTEAAAEEEEFCVRLSKVAEDFLRSAEGERSDGMASVDFDTSPFAKAFVVREGLLFLHEFQRPLQRLSDFIGREQRRALDDWPLRSASRGCLSLGRLLVSFQHRLQRLRRRVLHSAAALLLLEVLSEQGGFQARCWGGASARTPSLTPFAWEALRREAFECWRSLAEAFERQTDALACRAQRDEGASLVEEVKDRSAAADARQTSCPNLRQKSPPPNRAPKLGRRRRPLSSEKKTKAAEARCKASRRGGSAAECLENRRKNRSEEVSSGEASRWREAICRVAEFGKDLGTHSRKAAELEAPLGVHDLAVRCEENDVGSLISNALLSREAALHLFRLWRETAAAALSREANHDAPSRSTNAEGSLQTSLACCGGLCFRCSAFVSQKEASESDASLSPFPENCLCCAGVCPFALCASRRLTNQRKETLRHEGSTPERVCAEDSPLCAAVQTLGALLSQHSQARLWGDCAVCRGCEKEGRATETPNERNCQTPRDVRQESLPKPPSAEEPSLLIDAVANAQDDAEDGRSAFASCFAASAPFAKKRWVLADSTRLGGGRIRLCLAGQGGCQCSRVSLNGDREAGAALSGEFALKEALAALEVSAQQPHVEVTRVLNGRRVVVTAYFAPQVRLRDSRLSLLPLSRLRSRQCMQGVNSLFGCLRSSIS